MVLVKLLELVGNHIYLQYANCFLFDNQVVTFCTRCTVLGLHFGICTTGGDVGEGKGRNSNLSVALLSVCAVDEFGQEKCGIMERQ